MKHLLPDKVTLLEKLKGMPYSLLAPRSHPREVTSLHTWTAITIQAATALGQVEKPLLSYSGDGWAATHSCTTRHVLGHPGSIYTCCNTGGHEFRISSAMLLLLGF